jgi:hypothetical protein
MAPSKSQSEKLTKTQYPTGAALFESALADLENAVSDHQTLWITSDARITDGRSKKIH